MGEKITRRELAALLGTAPLVAQQTMPVSQTANDDEKAARDRIHRGEQQLAAVTLSMFTGPAFLFKP